MSFCPKPSRPVKRHISFHKLSPIFRLRKLAEGHTINKFHPFINHDQARVPRTNLNLRKELTDRLKERQENKLDEADLWGWLGDLVPVHEGGHWQTLQLLHVTLHNHNVMGLSVHITHSHEVIWLFVHSHVIIMVICTYDTQPWC